MSIRDDVLKNVQKQAMEITMKLMADERTRPYVAKAMQGLNDGRQKAETVRNELLTQMGLATQDQVKNAQKEAAKLARKLEKLQAQIEALQGAK